MTQLAADSSEKPLIVWRLVDGKPGHENQTLGLCNALARQVPIQREDIVVKGRLAQLFELFRGKFSQGQSRPQPDLILGAGHSTHIALIAARRCFGGRTVVLMRPSLPLSFFDLCLIPQHDKVSGPNVLQTRGALNTLVPHDVNSEGPLLLLLGGPSGHYDWQETQVLEQVLAIAEKNRHTSCVLANSRRTPDSFFTRIEAQMPANLTLVNWQSTDPGWLEKQLEKSHAAWVSEDSVSMVYEALSMGLPVGLIELTPHQGSRVASGMQQLKRDSLVTPYGTWKTTNTLAPPTECFNEATRCAEWIQNKWL